MKRVILIYPEGRKKGNYPNQKGHDYTLQLPISLIPIAFFLQRGGYNPVIFDARVEDYMDLSLDGVICTGISIMTGIQIANAIEIAQHIKRVNPKMPIIWGGIHSTLLPEQTVSHDLVDVVVRGEGEATMLELVQHLKSGKPLRDVSGITYKENGHIFSNEDRDFIDLNQLQNLPWDLFKIDKYKDVMLSDEFFLNTSRGCPHNCTFCYNLAFNKKKWRHQLSSVVVDQVRLVVNQLGVKTFFFGTEDNFFVSRERVEEICKGLIQQGIKIEWTACCRADYFSKYSNEFIALLKEAGCKTLYFGGESGSEYILRRIKKGILPNELIKTAEKCGEFDITPVFSFMTGFPFETEEDLKETFKIIDRILSSNDKAEVNGLFAFVPYPGTPLFYTAKQAGFKEPQSLEEWSKIQFGDESHLPWLNSKKRHFLNIIYRLSTFPFYSKSPNYPPALKKKRTISLVRTIFFQFKRFIWMLFWISARIRWKYKLFKGASEWKLWDWYARKRRIW